MKSDNVVQQKSFQFAVRIINMYKYLNETKKEYTLSKQLLRSGTSIGANIEEGIGGQSEKDFISKFSIAYKETRETQYWIRLLIETDYIEPDQAKCILVDTDELLKLIGAILNTMNKKINL